MKNTLRNITLDDSATFGVAKRDAIAAANFHAGLPSRDAIAYVTAPTAWQRFVAWLLA